MRHRSSSEDENSRPDEKTNHAEDETLANHNNGEVKRILYSTHCAIFLYATCYWIQIGVMPYLTRKLGVDTKMFGYLQSSFAFVQLCGGPLYGRFGDLFGGRSALILAGCACVLSYGLLGVAWSIPVLFLSRLPSVAMHCMQGAQMVVTDVTSNHDRAAGIGQLGISYGVGMVMGPLLGGFVADYVTEQAAAYVAMGGSVALIVVITIFIPKDTKKYGDQINMEAHEVHNEGSVLDISKYLSIFRAPNFTYLFVVKAVSSLPIGVFQAMFSVFAMDYFQLEAKQNGMVLSFVGVTSMVVQGFGTKVLTERHSESVLIKYSIALITTSYFLLIFVKNIYTFMLVILPLIAGGSVFTVVITSLVTKCVPSKDTGAALGISMATNSLIRTVSPTIGGLIYTAFGFPVIGLFGFIVNAMLTTYLFLYGRGKL